MFKPLDKITGFIWIIIVLTVLAWCSSCGKKAPPMAPRQPAMTAVEDLKADYHKGAVVLAWYHQPTTSAVTGYQIYRAKQDGALPACPGCPLMFEKTKIITVDPDRYDKRHKLSHREIVDSGFRFIFKVVPTQSSGAMGPDSNLVTVEAHQ